jgi:hypothetical protein
MKKFLLLVEIWDTVIVHYLIIALIESSQILIDKFIVSVEERLVYKFAFLHNFYKNRTIISFVRFIRLEIIRLIKKSKDTFFIFIIQKNGSFGWQLNTFLSFFCRKCFFDNMFNIFMLDWWQFVRLFSIFVPIFTFTSFTFASWFTIFFLGLFASIPISKKSINLLDLSWYSFYDPRIL